ncbi:MAG: hypothetical protein J7527_13265, partial [Chitinophagaceae bacterium]|nr:hypothetical protein [Chitinophagaceae bacterium]
MKWVKATKVQWYSFLASMPLIDLGLNHILFGDRIFHDAQIWLISFPLIWLMGLVIWYGHVLHDRWAERRYPEISQSGKRILVKCLVV